MITMYVKEEKTPSKEALEERARGEKAADDKVTPVDIPEGKPQAPDVKRLMSGSKLLLLFIGTTLQSPEPCSFRATSLHFPLVPSLLSSPLLSSPLLSSPLLSS